jgi:hypothetical protein
MSRYEVNWIPVRAAAKMLKVSRQRVHELCRRGDLRSEMVEHTLLVSLRSVVERVERLAKGGLSGGTRR